MKKKNIFKVVLLLTAILTLPGVFHAQQHCDSITNHSAGWYFLRADGVIQLNDGNLLSRNLIYGLDENGEPFVNENLGFDNFLGYKYYWISKDGLNVYDSLFVESTDETAHLWTRLHQDGNSSYCNVDACVVNEEDHNSYLKIAFFDDMMNYSDELEVTVPLTNSEALVSCVGSWLLDSHNDIILQYSVPSREQTCFARFGLDGTLKTEKVFTSPQMYYYSGPFSSWEPEGLSQYSSSCYNYYGTGIVGGSQDHFIAYELDQDFNITNTYDLDWQSAPSNCFSNGLINGTVSLEEGGALIVRNIKWSNDFKSTGIVKYDRDGNVLKEIWFNQLNNGRREMYCSSLKKDNQNNIYFTGDESSSNGEKQLTVIKLDTDLSVIWEYSGMNDTQRYYQAWTTEILDEESVAVVGNNRNWRNMVNGLFLVLLSKEKGNSGVSETENSVRPYLMYPNPVVDKLNVHYSPDVKPVKVEVLDLQGRLLGAQKGSLESIDMQNLPTGTYTINMTLDNGKTYSDKIVKQ